MAKPCAKNRAVPDVRMSAANGLNELCVPGMGMDLRGESPLYIVWRVAFIDHFEKLLVDGKGGRVSDRLKEA